MAFSYTAYRTASTATAITAFSPTAGVLTGLSSAASCSLLRMLQLTEKLPPISWSNATSRFAQIAAVSCDASAQCRGRVSAKSHSVVIRHDRAFTDRSPSRWPPSPRPMSP